MMMKINGILIIIIGCFEFIFNWEPYETREFSRARPNPDPVAMLDRDPIAADDDRRSRFVDEIIKNPIFVEGRLGVVGDAVSETTILIDGLHTPVELVGTIGSGEDSAAAFSLGDEKIMWLGRSEWLGDWQIDDIKQQFVRLRSPDETLVLQQRKGEGGQLSPETSDRETFQPDEILIN